MPSRQAALDSLPRLTALAGNVCSAGRVKLMELWGSHQSQLYQACELPGVLVLSVGGCQLGSTGHVTSCDIAAVLSDQTGGL